MKVSSPTARPTGKFCISPSNYADPGRRQISKHNPRNSPRARLFLYLHTVHVLPRVEPQVLSRLIPKRLQRPLCWKETRKVATWAFTRPMAKRLRIAEPIIDDNCSPFPQLCYHPSKASYACLRVGLIFQDSLFWQLLDFLLSHWYKRKPS